MPICHKNKFIFFHIPRCGGTSIEQIFEFHSPEQLFGVLENNDQVITLHHLTPPDLRNLGLIKPDIYDSYFKFTIIRDPFERMASDYHWQQKYDVHNEFKGLTFDQYIQRAEKIVNQSCYFEKKHYDHFRPMSMYCTQDNQWLVDDILLLENIDSELDRIQHKLGGKIVLPKVNASENYEYLRTQENLDKVYRFYAADKALYDQVSSL